VWITVERQKNGSEFTPAHRPQNHLGVMSVANWTTHFRINAKSFTSADAKQSAWQLAGVVFWRALNNAASPIPPPKDELGTTQHIVETSNRRFRDDDSFVPLKLTKGRPSSSRSAEVHSRQRFLYFRDTVALSQRERN